MPELKILASAEGMAMDLFEPGTTGLKLNVLWIEDPVIVVGRLKRGTKEGNSTVTIRLNYKDAAGNDCHILTQTTLKLFVAAGAAMKAYEEADAAMHMPPVMKVQ